MDAQGTSSEPVGVASQAEADPVQEEQPGFAARGRMRRRLRFLRKTRELGYRDLGGLVFEMQRMGERHDELVAAKLALLGAVDTELRALEAALADRHPVTVLREAGIAACPRCAAIHGSEDRFCPACGLAIDRHADRPIGAAATPAAPAQAVPAASSGPPAPPPNPLPAIAAAPPAATPAPPDPPAATPAPPATPATSLGAPAAGPATTPGPPATPAGPAPATGADDRPTEILRPGERGQ
ncbi:MAG TPA: hypothetical protein VMU32_08405 [Solirubrobacteraceae bacterium]|nr:hypothetical protein [Solirubrobacteraceae bacterium]